MSGQVRNGELLAKIVVIGGQLRNQRVFRSQVSEMQNRRSSGVAGKALAGRFFNFWHCWVRDDRAALFAATNQVQFVPFFLQWNEKRLLGKLKLLALDQKPTDPLKIWISRMKRLQARCNEFGNVLL